MILFFLYFTRIREEEIEPFFRQEFHERFLQLLSTLQTFYFAFISSNVVDFAFYYLFFTKDGQGFATMIKNFVKDIKKSINPKIATFSLLLEGNMCNFNYFYFNKKKI